MASSAIDISGVDISGAPITLPLPDKLGAAVTDLSGVIHSGADLLRYVPALAAAAQAVGGSGSEKLALVQRAAHTAVDLYVPAEERTVAHQLVDGVLPSVVRAILDVSKGHVKIQDVLATAATTVLAAPEVQAAGATLAARCFACLLAPRAVAAPVPAAAVEKPVA